MESNAPDPRSPIASRDVLPLTEMERFNSFRLIRDEIVHEDNLIGQRLGWFLASQAFLLTALAIAHGNQRVFPGRGNNYFFPLIPLLAIATSVLILAGVLAGIEAIARWRRMLILPEFAAGDRFPRIGRDGWIIRCGWLAPIALPTIFLLAWCYLLVRGLEG